MHMVRSRQTYGEPAAVKYDSGHRLGDDRVSKSSPTVSSCALKGMQSNLIGEIPVLGDAGANLFDFKTLDDRAAEVLRKSVQALEISHMLGREYLNSAQSDFTHEWARDKLNQTSAEMNFTTLGCDLLDCHNMELDCPEAATFPRKLGGASSERNEKLFQDYFFGSEKEDSQARKPSNPNKCNAEHRRSEIESDLMDYSVDDDRKGKITPRRWPQMSAKYPRVQMNTKNVKEAGVIDTSTQHTSVNYQLRNSARTKKDENKGYLSKRGPPEAEWRQKEPGLTSSCVMEYQRGTLGISCRECYPGSRRFLHEQVLDRTTVMSSVSIPQADRRRPLLFVQQA
ncbi:hypothetical protein R1flu_000746 [Riccia fluitans]|uniref:Uncharacterized protein n=1 Tax=Riccia fluitans TaxID=41844 RepID=A0ABD1Y1B3_9MARC